MILNHSIYKPLYENKDKFIILVTGGRGSGKSFSTSTFIERLTFELGKDLNGRKISHQILYSRYTMVSAGMSIIPEVMDKIQADGVGKYFARSGQDIVNVMTGSHIMFRGIRTSSGNQTAKLKSIKGLTVFVCDEAEEFVSEDDFEKIMFSIRQQGLKNLVIIIMNPTDSNHFIYQKYIKDTHKLVEYDGVPVQISTHPNVLHIHTSYLDNVKYLADNFLEEAKAMKERDPERYAHIFMGKWSDVAEGAVFKKWGIVKEFPEYCKKVALACDFGYTNDVTAIVKCGIVDNRLYMQELCYRSSMLSSDIIKEIRKHNENGSLFLYSESADPRLVDEIALGGIIIYPVQKGAGSIVAGIDKMNTMELFVTEDSLNLQDELRNYTWARDKEGKYINTPIDAYNHCFTGDTMVMTDKGEKRIDTLKIGDKVLTSAQYRNVHNFYDNGHKEVLHVRLIFSNFEVELTATADHKIKTTQGWKELEKLTQGDALFLCKSSMVKNTICTRMRSISQEEPTECTKSCGDSTMEKYPRGIMSIIRMKTLGTMIYPIWSSLRQVFTSVSTCKQDCKTQQNLRKQGEQWTMQGSSQTCGTSLLREESGTANTPSKLQQICDTLQRFVRTVVRNIKLSQQEKADSAQMRARVNGEGDNISMMSSNTAHCVESPTTTASISKNSIVMSADKKDCEYPLKQDVQECVLQRMEIVSKSVEHVYDIEVEGEHEFFANGVLVHNCLDSVRYYVLAALLGKVMKPKNVTKEQLGIF